jgi:hypothetical protein
MGTLSILNSRSSKHGGKLGAAILVTDVWATGVCFIELQGHASALRLKVPRSKPSPSAGFWLFLDEDLELVSRLHHFLIRVGGQVSSRHLHVVRTGVTPMGTQGPEFLNMKYSMHEANPWTALASISGSRSLKNRVSCGGSLMGRFTSKVGPSSIPPSSSAAHHITY